MNIISKIQKEFSGQKALRDGWLLGLFAMLALANGFLIIWSITHIHSADIDVPIRFTSLANFDQLGRWYQLYEIAGISLIVAAINSFFAVLLQGKNRILSIFLLIAAIMVAILSIAIIFGFSAIHYGTS